MIFLYHYRERGFDVDILKIAMERKMRTGLQTSCAISTSPIDMQANDLVIYKLDMIYVLTGASAQGQPFGSTNYNATALSISLKLTDNVIDYTLYKP